MSEVSKELFSQLDNLLSSVDFKDVSAEGAGFEDLKPGYYLSEVEKAEITESKSSGLPMVKIMFRVVEDGIGLNENEERVNLKGKNRVLFKYYVFKDDGGASVKRMASDMLKFEDDNGESILPKEAFVTAETLEASLDVIKGMRIYVQLTESERNGEKTTWSNLTTWKRAAALGLPGAEI